MRKSILLFLSVFILSIDCHAQYDYILNRSYAERSKSVDSLLFTTAIFSNYYCSAQYEAVNVELEVSGPTKKYHHFSVKLYSKDSKYYIEVEALSDFPESKVKDATYTLDKPEFDSIVKQALSISSEDLIKGMNVEDPYYFDDGIMCNLRVSVAQDAIAYSALSPYYDTKRRNLSVFLSVCEELLKQANINPKKALR